MRNRGKMLEVVARYDQPYKADIAQAKLIVNGIRAELANDAVARWNPFLSPAIGGVSVLVKASDLTRARKVLGNLRK